MVKFLKAETEQIKKEIEDSLDLIKSRYNLDECEKRLAELTYISEQDHFWAEREYAQEIMRERQSIISKIELCEVVKSDLEDTLQLIVLADSEGELTVLREAEESLSLLREEVKVKEIEALLNGEMDSNDTFIEINSGAGGTESCDWAQMLARMYLRYAEKKGFQVELISQTNGDDAGIKSVAYKVKGLNAYGFLKHESGVHRLVRISPFDSNSRRHTSFSSVWVYPVVSNNIDVKINLSDLRIDTYRSSGAGGQHVNTTDSAVRITHLPSGIVVTSSEKSQHQNRSICMDALKSRLYDIEMQKKLKGIQAQHEQKGEAGWGNQIRSYVLHPYQMVKDLRTDEEITDTQSVLNGGIDKFIFAALSKLTLEE